MNKYAVYFENGGSIIINATDDEDAAWLGVAHARLEMTLMKDIQPLNRHHYIPEIQPREDYCV